MRRHLTILAGAIGLLGAVVFAPNAIAGGSVAVSIATPGFAVGYSNYGGYAAAYPPPVYYAPAPVYYGPAYYGAPAVVAYGAYRPWYHHHAYYGPYYRHW
ncbi:MAG TPA: hypothetical protein VEN29_07265 [Casimicrobiaceae bacterium]|nr:hypothetical protein [Casimicrobiaceae bacterium]